jgi:hypothetical protein
MPETKSLNVKNIIGSVHMSELEPSLESFCESMKLFGAELYPAQRALMKFAMSAQKFSFASWVPDPADKTAVINHIIYEFNKYHWISSHVFVG